MAIDTSAITGQQTYPTPPANPKGELGADAFMKLLVAELKQQDPQDPMKSRDIVGQLAELTNVAKLSGIDDKLSTLQNLTAANSGIQNAGLIGRKVEADTRSLTLGEQGGANTLFQLGDNAQSVSVKVRDGQGNAVKTIELGQRKLGPQQLTWDGTTDAGGRAAAGLYSFEITAKAASGQLVTASTKLSGVVTGVSYENGSPEVMVGSSRIPLGDITTIGQ